jgi:hypothetical protein
MNAMTKPPSAQVTKTLGHVAMHYRKPEEGPLAARLLQLIGLNCTQTIPLPDGTNFYRFTTNFAAPNSGDGIIYVSALPETERAVIEATRAALKVDQPGEHPAVAAQRAFKASDPEAGFHVAFLYDSLDALEDMMLRMRDLAETDPELKGRIRVVLNRGMRGTPDVDARLDASPLYGDVERFAFGKHGVQAFVETDIFCTGPLGEGLTLEFDYIFPGYDSHILSVVELDARA